MIQRLKQHNRLKISILLGIMSVFCLALSLLRMYFSGKMMYFFLNWNLFLAIIPWICSSAFILWPKLQNSEFFVFLMLGIWLLFFPNSPYILTDLFHLKKRIPVPLWFDLVLILSYAWTGLLFGFLSLLDVEFLIRKVLKLNWTNYISVVLIFLGSFGVYLGRFLRWNSWDIMNEFDKVMYDVGHRVVYPLEHTTTWGVTLLLGFLLNMIFFSFKLIKKQE